MATMVKEKRREKKKSKEKTSSRSSREQEQPSVLEDMQSENVNEPLSVQDVDSSIRVSANVLTTSANTISSNEDTKQLPTSSNPIQKNPKTFDKIMAKETNLTHDNAVVKTEKNIAVVTESVQNDTLQRSEMGNLYQDLSNKLERMAIPKLDPEFNVEEFENKLEAQFNTTNEAIVENVERQERESIMPSAPMLEEDRTHYYEYEHVAAVSGEPLVPPKVKSMPLEEAINLYGGKEMADVRAMSEREEAIVEAGPVSGPEHPLVDLLTTFRSSLIAVERERIQLTKSYLEEEKYRNSLWRVEKRSININEDCLCGATIHFTAKYDHAELLKEKLPVAKLKLEGLLRDVQESYCHHQHAALLAHCQIEELISETIKSSKKEIREALFLILQALKMSDNAPSALATALQRWAKILSASLLDGRDLRQLLYLMHHLFRQTRSVRWAAKIIRGQITAGSRSESAHCIALLDLLLARPGLETALECTEEAEEGWEEMDNSGEGGAVCEGSLRERDLIAVFRAFPLRALVARLAGFTNVNITQARPTDWGDNTFGNDVLKSCCGVRTLLDVVERAMTSHRAYPRLLSELRALATRCLRALAGLHLHCKDYYSKCLQDKIHAELETCFATGFNLLTYNELHKLPATLLQDNTVKEYCTALIIGLHDKSERQLTSLSIEIPPLDCGIKVKIATQAAIDRKNDLELSRMVLEFLFQTGIKKNQCKNDCNVIAKECLPELLIAHPYLHTTAFHILADINQIETLDSTCIAPLSINLWRPSPDEIKKVLDDWSQRCQNLIQHLLLNLDFKSLSLESQLTVGYWLCEWQKGDKKSEWTWTVLRRLRVHRSFWGSFDAPSPEMIPEDIFSNAFAVLATAWGHCIPLICSEGVNALCKIANVRPSDAIHCLGPVMLVMAHSPESVSLTPKFSELFNILLKSGPTIVQRALGMGPIPGADLILRLILKQIDNCAIVSRSSLVSAWLHALWRPSLNAYSQLDTLLLATREWQLFDAHISQLLQEKNSFEHITNAVANVSTAPMICECVLRNAHTVREVRTVLIPRLLDVLHLQRIAGDRIHVDNALKQIGYNMSAEDLVIYKTASAVLYVTPQSPAHVTLWAFFFYLYLQRPPSSMQDATPSIGPLFFSGLIKSRVLGQLRKKLQEIVTYHHNESEILKQNSIEVRPQVPPRSRHGKENVTEEGLVPILTQKDLTGESSDSSEDESVEDDISQQDIEQEIRVSLEMKTEYALKLKYHVSAESMFKEYLRWFDEGDKTFAMPHHADVARFIPEQVLAAAWSRELETKKPAPISEELPLSVQLKPSKTPFQMTIENILSIKDFSTKRSRIDIKSPLEDIDFRDARNLLNLIDKYLQDIETLADEWSHETARIMSLDTALWDLVCALRVKRPIPSVQKQCPNKCKARNIHIPHEEWCISTGAERGIIENRRSAKALIKRLARPRPHAAHSTATLTAIARKIRSSESAVRICDRIWRCARTVQNCTPAQSAVRNFLEIIAERWMCHDGKLCSELLNRWGNNCNTTFQESLCGLLINPRRLDVSQWILVYKSVLHSKLPSHTVFSYLSKFEMSRWRESESGQRRELLDALLTTSQRWGPNPDEEHHVLLELLGVHTTSLLTAGELCGYTALAMRSARAHRLPPAALHHLTGAVGLYGGSATHDQLGHLLRELGVLWWEARTGVTSNKNAISYVEYASYVAELLSALQRAFTAATVAMSYAPERVAVYTWSSLQESWSPWIAPHPAPTLLEGDSYTEMLKTFVDTIHQCMLDCPVAVYTWLSQQESWSPWIAPHPAPTLLEGDSYTEMLKTFVDTIHQCILDCPGSEVPLLQQIFEWTVQTYLTAGCVPAQGTRPQLCAMLEQLSRLPWGEHQWFKAQGMQYALQVCASNDRSLQLWCSASWRHTLSESWLRGAEDRQLAALLASALYLFTAMPQHDTTLEQAARLPWWRLPEMALEEAMERFFVQYHNPAQAYHTLPQFRVLLYASELLIQPSYNPTSAISALPRQKRATAMSRWLCAACTPTLIEHVKDYTQYMLDIVSQIAPYLEESSNEMEELLGRALAIMCMEPAAKSALPVWQHWMESTTDRLLKASISAISLLTAFEYFGALADTAIRAYLLCKESEGWPEIYTRLKASHWNDPAPLCARAHMHAAYAVLRTQAHSYATVRTAILAILAANINFKENDVIIALWIAASARITGQCATETQGEAGECAAGGRALLTRWGEEPRHSLLKMVTLQSDDGSPTARHRLLCRLAQCILSNSDTAIKAYESSCVSILGSTSDALGWGRTPRPIHLPRLAVRLYPSFEKYFKDELSLISED